MGEIVKLRQTVTDRRCPKCGYLASQMEIELARFDFPCPRGCDHTFKDFQPIKLKTDALESDKE